MKIHPRLSASVFALLALGLGSAAARAQSGTPQDPFPITGPTTITQSGYYQLKNNINYSGTSGTIITVNANNLTIDLNGFYIAGPVGNGNNTVTGIFANNRANITVTNGTVAWCYVGIEFTSAAAGSSGYNNIGHRVLGLRMPRNYSFAIDASNVTNLEVRNNLISLTSGSTYGGGSDHAAYGVFTQNGSAAITDNTIDVVTGAGQGLAAGIYSYNSGTNLVANNTVTNITGNATLSWGIYFDNGTGCFAVGNKIGNASNGLNMSGNGSTLGRYQANLTSNIAGTRFANGSDSELNH